MSSIRELPSLNVFNGLNLYESWLLTELTPSLIHFSEKGLSEKNSFLEDFAIYYIFNIRRHIDPLFSAKIYALIRKDVSFFQTVHSIVSSLLQNTFIDKNDLKIILDQSNVRNDVLKNDDASVLALEFYSHPESLITIYKNIQLIALAEGNLETLELVNTVLEILEKISYAVKDIAETENSYGTVFPLGEEMLELKRFVTTHVQNLKQYISNIPSNRIVLMNLCASNLTDIIITEIKGFLNDKNLLTAQFHFNKVIGNFLSIICSSWFMSRSMKDRLELLNNTSSPSIWLENVKEGSLFADFTDLQIWNFYLNTLSSLGCFREIHAIITYIIENIPHLQSVEKVFFYDHLTYANIQLEEYSTALKNLAYENNLILTSQAEGFKKSIHISILKNQAECYYYLQDQENFKKCLIDIDTALLELDTTELSSTLHFLSILGKSLHDIELEKKYLAKLAALTNSNSYTKYAADRITQLTINEQKGKVSEDVLPNSLQNVFRYVEFMFSTFNFDHCIELINKVKPAIDILPDKQDKIRFYRPLALSYLFIKEYNLAEETFKLLIKEEEHNPEYKLFLLVLGIVTHKSELIEPYLSILRTDTVSAYDIKNLRLLLYFIIHIEKSDSIGPSLNILEHVISTDKIAFFRSLAVVLSEYGFLPEAKKYLDMALVDSKGRLSKSAIYYDMANLLVKQNQFSDAISLYNNSLASNENDSKTFLNEALVHSYLFDYKSALENINQALNVWDTLNPHEKEYYLYIKSLIQESIQIIPILNTYETDRTQKILHQYEYAYLRFMFCDSTWYGNITTIFIRYLLVLQKKLDKAIAEPFLHYYNERYANLTFGINWKSQELSLKKYIDSHGRKKISILEWRNILKNFLLPAEKKVPKFDEFVHKLFKTVNFVPILASCEHISPIINTILTMSSYDSHKIIEYHRTLIEEVEKLNEIFPLST